MVSALAGEDNETPSCPRRKSRRRGQTRA